MTDSRVKSNTDIPIDATEVTFGDFYSRWDEITSKIKKGVRDFP